MSTFDELVKKRGVLVAGKFGPDWRIAEQKVTGLFVELPQAIAFMGSACAAIEMMFRSMAFSASGFMPGSWWPVKGWAFSGGAYSIAMAGDRFVVAETAKLESYDEVLRLLAQDV